MNGTVARKLLLALLALAAGAAALTVAGVLADRALADGDPASDILYAQDLFLPYTHPVSKPVGARLQQVVKAARRGHYPVKVALISGPQDLGVVPGLFGQPQNYARFMTEEMRDQIVDPVLVVMPAGLGFAQAGRTLGLGPVTNVTPGSGATPDDLANAAASAVPKLAAANGHKLTGLPPGPSTGGGPSGAVIALIVVGGLAVLAGLLALVRRRNARLGD
jgi:hypothetical protein